MGDTLRHVAFELAFLWAGLRAGHPWLQPAGPLAARESTLSPPQPHGDGVQEIECAGLDGSSAIAGYLSLTMPLSLWEGMQRNLDKSCLTIHAWKQIEKHL